MTHTPLDNFFQSIKCTAANKEDVLCIDINEALLGVFAPALRRNTGDGALKDFQQCLLYAFAGNITRNGSAVALAGNFVDLINIDDTSLSFLDIIIGVL